MILFVLFSVKPEFPRGIFTSTSVIENRRVNLPCPAQGNPSPSISWFKNDIPLTGNEIGITLNDDGSLDIDNARAEHAGVYKCEATNAAGSVFHVIDLDIFSELLTQKSRCC